ncbi:MAG: hypothetical protein H6Q10_3430, partial [Acidobacteria bacterium]|nr:hypothetical protein [Acidobacteriota bacterium]
MRRTLLPALLLMAGFPGQPGPIGQALRPGSPPPQPRPAAEGPRELRALDLSGDASRRVVVDREPGQYLGHPTTVLLEDARTMIAVYPRGHGRGPIVMKRSEDGGLTWSGRLA